MTKSESPNEIRMTKDRRRRECSSTWSLGFGHWDLIRGFGFRISVFFLLTLLPACDKQTGEPTTSRSAPTVASMVPAATDLLVGMGAKDRLVAVSTFDNNRSDVGSLPKAGDYQTVDWEMLRSLHPSFLISQIQPERQSPGYKARADELHITPINIQIEQLSDIFVAIDQLANAIAEPQLAVSAADQMHRRLDAVKAQASKFKPVSVLLVIDAHADAIVGTGTFLDDLLKLAGGENVAGMLHQHWPQIDREMLLSMNPEVIIQLLGDASPQEKQQASEVWKHLPQLRAVSSGRVYPIYDWYVLIPGWHVTDLAEQFLKCLHPPQPASRP